MGLAAAGAVGLTAAGPGAVSGASAPADDAQPIRLQVLLARTGVASRRTAEQMIAAGRVAVNGVAQRTLGAKVIPGHDRVTVDGKPIAGAEPLRYFALHKPRGVLSSAGDVRGRPTVIDFLPPDAGRCVPVGRLDFDSEGLLLLSNDGPLVHGLLHPRFQLPREYLVQIRGTATDAALARLAAGVRLPDGSLTTAKGRRVKPPARLGSGETSWLLLTLYRGQKREVRLLCAAVGHPVARLIRVRFGPVRLGDLPPGQIRHLSSQEQRLLRRFVERGRATPIIAHDGKGSPHPSRSSAGSSD